MNHLEDIFALFSVAVFSVITARRLIRALGRYGREQQEMKKHVNKGD
jgi:hypothetical protein